MAQPPNFTDMPPGEPSQALAGDTAALPATLPSAATTGPALRNGARVGRYIILQPLGEGGMGVVYAAYDPELDRKVALKLLREEVTAGGSGEGRERLLREAHAMAKLNHPNVVTIYDSGVHGEQVFLAVELVAGTDLWTWLTEPRGWREVLEVFLKAGRGLVAAHAAGLLHRDFKAENVLLGKQGEVKVADFGLARAASLTATRSTSSVQLPVASPETLFRPLTKAGLVSGTPGFIAPEQLAGLLGDARSDEFSFCVTLYQALYRQRPFAQQLGPRGEHILAEAPKGTQVPTWLRKVVVRGLAAKPEDRYPSMGALLEALEVDPARRRRRVLSAIGMVALVLAASAATGLVIWRHRVAGDPCRNDRPLAGVWDDSVHQRLAKAFQASPQSPGETSAESSGGARWKEAEKALDRTADEWLAAHSGLCADSLSGKQTEAVVRLRLNCLDGQRDQLSEMTQALAAPTPAMVAAASAVVQTLDFYPSDCTDGDPRVLSIVERPPPEKAAAIAALRARLIQATALRFNGEPKEALTDLQALLVAVRAAGAGRVEARVLAEIGFIQEDQQLMNEPVATLQEALRVAEFEHLDILAAFLGTELVGALTAVADGQAELPAALARARQLVASAGNVPSARATLENALGNLANLRGSSDEAVPHFQEALRLVRQLGGPDEVMQEPYLSGLGFALIGSGRDAEGIAVAQENIALAARLDGKRNRTDPWCLFALAQALRHVGRPLRGPGGRPARDRRWHRIERCRKPRGAGRSGRRRGNAECRRRRGAAGAGGARQASSPRVKRVKRCDRRSLSRRAGAARSRPARPSAPAARRNPGPGQDVPRSRRSRLGALSHHGWRHRPGERAGGLGPQRARAGPRPFAGPPLPRWLPGAGALPAGEGSRRDAWR